MAILSAVPGLPFLLFADLTNGPALMPALIRGQRLFSVAWYKSVMLRTMTALLVAAAAIATPALARSRDNPDVQLQKLLDGRVAGKPTDCIMLRNVISSQIIDKTAIVYRVGSTLYVNQPRSGADSLERDDVLLTKTFSSDLCSTDTVQLLDWGTHFPRGFVFLGKFVPYTLPKHAS
jgi:hypothetical protein